MSSAGESFLKGLAGGGTEVTGAATDDVIEEELVCC
jgi:hypothetical protein